MFRVLMWIVKVSALGEIFLLFPPPPYKKLGPYRFSNGNSVQISEKKTVGGTLSWRCFHPRRCGDFFCDF